MLPSLGFVLGPAGTGHLHCGVPATGMVSDTPQEHNQTVIFPEADFFFLSDVSYGIPVLAYTGVIEVMNKYEDSEFPQI